MDKFLGIVLAAFALFGSTASAQDVAFGDWLYTSRIDLITDENRSTASAWATTYPQYAAASGIIIRCSDFTRYGIEVFFSADKYLGSDSAYEIVYRVDGGTPVRGLWSRSTTGESAFAPDLAVSGIVRDLLDSRELIFRITGFSQDYTYVVPVSGLRQAITKLGCYTGTL